MTISRRRALLAIAAAGVLLGSGMVVGLIVGVRATPSGEGIGLTELVPAPEGSDLPVPRRGHVWMVVLENHGNDAIVGASEAPFFNGLAAQGAVADEFQAVAHPSFPNYLALVSGSTHGILDNEQHTVDAPSIFDQVEAAGRSWRVSAENVPDGCFQGMEASGGRDGPGTYARRHEPAISFQSIASDPGRCARIGDLTSFTADGADFQIIIPNLCHDMHSCSVEEGDAWLRTFVPRILESPEFGSDGLLVITFDEDDRGDVENDVPTVVLGPAVKPGFVSYVPHTQYSLLKTIQGALGLPCLAASCDANTLGELFQ